MPVQKLQSLFVEFIHLLIDGGVSAAGEDDEFGLRNVGLHPLGKAGGGGPCRTGQTLSASGL